MPQHIMLYQTAQAVPTLARLQTISSAKWLLGLAI